MEQPSNSSGCHHVWSHKEATSVQHMTIPDAPQLVSIPSAL